jgi:hypothetical protein
MELAFQVVAPQELRRTLGRLRTAPRDQIESSGKRVARRVANLDPFRACRAAAHKRRCKADDDKRTSEPQPRLVTVLRTHWRGGVARRPPRFIAVALEQ